jgi:hypothetical protein
MRATISFDKMWDPLYNYECVADMPFVQDSGYSRNSFLLSEWPWISVIIRVDIETWDNFLFE